jgi:hypothetical protein
MRAAQWERKHFDCACYRVIGARIREGECGRCRVAEKASTLLAFMRLHQESGAARSKVPLCSEE